MPLQSLSQASLPWDLLDMPQSAGGTLVTEAVVMCGALYNIVAAGCGSLLAQSLLRVLLQNALDLRLHYQAHSER